MPIYWNGRDYSSVFGRPKRCHHRCVCGAELKNCGGDPDRCIVGDRWTCPSCDLAALDAYLEAVERDIQAERVK